MGNNRIDIQLDGHVDTFHGVLSRQWYETSGRFVVTFSAQNLQGISIWGSKLD
jgi:arabinan endo-1,5-alpha-L-arabinosidase